MARDTFELQFGEEGPTAIVLDDQQKDVCYRDIANCSIPVFFNSTGISDVMESPTIRGIPAKTTYKFIACGISHLQEGIENERAPPITAWPTRMIVEPIRPSVPEPVISREVLVGFILLTTSRIANYG
ncbi:hypothetical protein I306_03027 [Cryptococcus gattii EJB2]|uniref:Uncharacterized protein n=1 Tax=Cryptococcus gattii EJB2 TaxID=1296103 RepID=A0ABR5BX32_9TREE|nr:hypothetical protein I306_03027 [Cryptococcus gattii EJB2]KJE05346.1 hypothetical protein I311_01025 [Cryptococcus gattii NT-10]